MFFVVGEIIEIRNYVLSWIENGNSLKYASTLMKICVVSFLGQWGIQLCRDANENTIADKMETAIKLIVIVLCFPYIDMLFKMVAQLQ